MFRNPVMTGVVLLGLPRLVIPLLLLVGFGMLLNLCHPACPVDPLTHGMVCLDAADPQGWQRAMEARAGVKKTPAQWEAEAELQRQFEIERAAFDAQQSARDQAASDRAVDQQYRQWCKDGQTEYCPPKAKKSKRRHHAHRAATKEGHGNE